MCVFDGLHVCMHFYACVSDLNSSSRALSLYVSIVWWGLCFFLHAVCKRKKLTLHGSQM